MDGNSDDDDDGDDCDEATENARADPPYPFNLPLFDGDIKVRFDDSVTIFVGENGSGKSTLLEAIAAAAGFGPAGAKGTVAGQRRGRGDASGACLAPHLRAAWLPQIGQGWFFSAATFYSVARYLDDVRSPNADFLSLSHGEGFRSIFRGTVPRAGPLHLRRTRGSAVTRQAIRVPQIPA